MRAQAERKQGGLEVAVGECEHARQPGDDRDREQHLHRADVDRATRSQRPAPAAAATTTATVNAANRAINASALATALASVASTRPRSSSPREAPTPDASAQMANTIAKKP